MRKKFNFRVTSQDAGGLIRKNSREFKGERLI